MTGLASCTLKRRARTSVRLAVLAQRAGALASNPMNVFIGSLVSVHEAAAGDEELAADEVGFRQTQQVDGPSRAVRRASAPKGVAPTMASRISGGMPIAISASSMASDAVSPSRGWVSRVSMRPKATQSTLTRKLHPLASLLCGSTKGVSTTLARRSPISAWIVISVPIPVQASSNIAKPMLRRSRGE